MLGKLIKYDINSTWRDFAGLYMMILLGVIVVPLIVSNASSAIINLTAGLIAFAIIVAVIVITILNLFKIFNTNVFSKEGYLTMTLPVTSGQVITSKLFVSSMWILLTYLVSFFGICIFAMILSSSNFAQFLSIDFKELFKVLGEKNTVSLIFTLILFTLSLIISTVKEVSKLFLACSISHLKQLNRFRIPAGILSYFIFSWAETALVQVLAPIAINITSNLDGIVIQMGSVTNQNDLSRLFDSLNLFSGIGALYTLFFTILYSLGTVWILNKKLELD